MLPHRKKGHRACGAGDRAGTQRKGENRKNQREKEVANKHTLQRGQRRVARTHTRTHARAPRTPELLEELSQFDSQSTTTKQSTPWEEREAAVLRRRAA